MWKITVGAALALALLVSPAQAQETERMTLVEAVNSGDADVMRETIRAKAAEDWPDDFSMQKHVVDRQMEALQWLGENVENAPEDVPEDVYERIVSKATADWPDDFTMIQHVIERQVEAYREIQ